MLKVGCRAGLYYDLSRRNWADNADRPMSWIAWYPTDSEHAEELQLRGPPGDPWFRIGHAVIDASLSDAKEQWPVVLLSHGTGGSADGMGWLGCRLAQNGFVAIAVSHHGNTAIEPYQAEGFLSWWERPRDLSEVLTGHLTDGCFTGRLDTHSVFAVGFSLGGYTVLSLAGAITDMRLFEQWSATEMPGKGPAEFPDLADHLPALLESSAVFRDSWSRQGACYADERVRAFVALAPAPTVRGFTGGSLSEIHRPVRLMVGGNDHEAPAETCSQWLFRQIPNAEITLLGSKVGHYVFLPESTDAGKQAEPFICVDPKGVDRAVIHEQAAKMSIKLFQS